MITRPLDLASGLRPPPRNFDAIFYVNVGLLALYFSLFGSRFVLSPAVEVSLPVMAGATPQASDVVISVRNADMVMADGVVLNFKSLPAWLGTRAQGQSGLRLLVKADGSLSGKDWAEIQAMALAAHFERVLFAVEPTGSSATGH